MRKIGWIPCAVSSDGNLGLLLLRLFAGAGLMVHGLPKLVEGADRWRMIGGVMGRIGIPGPAVFWGFMAALAEGLGGLFLVLGVFTSTAALLIAITMTVAAFVAHAGDPFKNRELALLYLAVSLLFMLKGAGRYSLDALALGSASRG